jgi:TPR repeat protein/AcrR family transcriptional regulator
VSNGSQSTMSEKQAETDEMPEFVKRRRPARRAILEVARRLLVRDGSDGLTPEAVAKESGLSVEIVYAYFCNRDELLLSIASDELSALNRAAKNGDKPEGKPGEELGILELPTIVEGFIAARADSAPESLDEQNEGAGEEHPSEAQVQKQNPEQAQKTNSDQTASTEEPPKPQPVTAPREAPRARRKSAPTSGIDGIVKDVAAGEQSGEASLPAMVARLERRLYVIERDLAEEAENSTKNKTEEPELTPGPELAPGDVEQLATRIGALEKRLKQMYEEIRAAQRTTSDRLRILEATPPGGPSFSEDVPGMTEPAIAFVETVPSEKDEDPRGGKGGGEEKSLQAFLTAARDAAKSAVADEEKSKSENNGSLFARWKQKASATLQATKSAFDKAEDTHSKGEEDTDSEKDDSALAGWKQKASELYDGATKLDRKTLLTRVVPITVVLVGLVVTAWAAMSPGQNLESAPIDISAASPGTVTAPATIAGPEPAPSREDALMAAAEAGDRDVQTLLGLSHLNGDGVAANPLEAVRMLQLASENGQAVAQYNLATIYARSDSTISDPIAAKFWFQEAAEQGNRMAMNNLAMFYAQGLGTDPNTAEAAVWFSMAAALGYDVAQYNLAVLFERGDGVPQDNVQAYKWYAIAGLQGDDDALERATLLAEGMDRDVLFDVQTEVADFEPAIMDPVVNDPPRIDSQTG